MERIRNKIYSLKDLQEGDRFYFVGNKTKTIHEVIQVENRFGSDCEINILVVANPPNGLSYDKVFINEAQELQDEIDKELNLWPKIMEDPCEYLQDPRDQIRAPVIRSKVKPIKAKTSGPAFNRRLDKRGRNPFRKPNL